MNDNINNHDFKTVKGCVSGIVLKDDNVLLTKRAIPPSKGKWCLPGGHIDIGETALDAAKREVHEETGLLLVEPKYFMYTDDYFPRQDFHAIALHFYGKASGEENMNKGEVSEQGWFSQNELKKMDLAFNHKEVLKKFFEEVRK